MKFGPRKISFIVIFLTFSIFSTQLFRNEQLLHAMFSIYLFLSASIIDICFHIKQGDSEKIRAVFWAILNAMVGLALGVYSFMKNDILLSSVIVIWIILSTISNIILIKKNSLRSTSNLK